MTGRVMKDYQCKSCLRHYQDRWREQISEQVFDHYGRVCVCCGATEDLTLDHVFGNGPEHRRLLGIRTGSDFHLYLLTNDFPPECEPGGEYELQVLCGACNTSKGKGDHCTLHCTDPSHKHRRYSPGSHRPNRTEEEIEESQAKRDAMIPIVLEILRLWDSTSHLSRHNPDKWTMKKLAVKFGLTQDQVNKLVYRKTWRDGVMSKSAHQLSA